MSPPAPAVRKWMRGLRLHTRRVLRVTQQNRRVTVTAIAMLVLGTACYVAYSEYEKRTLPRAITALVRDTGSRLHDALQWAHNDNAVALQHLDDHYAAVNGHLGKLRTMNTARVEDLARAADDYLLTAREILRRLAADHRTRDQVLGSVRALRTHMRSDNRSGAWITLAVRRKEQLETEYRAYRLTSEALAGLLEQYASSRERLAHHIDPSLLPEDRTAFAARERLLTTLRAMAKDVERAGELDAYR